MENSHEIYANNSLSISTCPRTRRLTVSPVATQTARAFTAWTHRHLNPPAEAEIVLGAFTGNGTLVGVVFAGGSEHGDEATAEVVCLSTDGTPDADRALLGAVWWAAEIRGYRLMSVGAHLRISGCQHGGGGALGALWVARTVGGRR
ncbi:hypothetical protein ACWEPC_29630 [Nonomuraea sp. NPDC004297]